MTDTLRIDVFSDVVCPWCYIGKQRFDTARDELSAPTDGSAPIDLDVRLHAFQLDPTADPDRTQPVIEAYAAKFGGAQQAEEILQRVTHAAAEVGLDFNMNKALRANTLRAHRLIWWASQPDNPLDPWTMNTRLMKAYFTEGRNVSDVDTLAELAAELGADRDHTSTMLQSDAGTAEVAQDLASAANAGVTAVPTFVVNQGWAVPGAQASDTLVRLLRRVAETGA